MKLTPALYVRHLLDRLYPPLPKSPRESQRLLNILETSFRKHLDETHPSPNAQRNSKEPVQHAIPLTSAASSSGATQQYVNMLLTHPLLGVQHERRINAAQEKNIVRQFQQAASEGRAGIDLLRRAVSVYSADLKASNNIKHERRLGPHIAIWLHSAPPGLKKAFFLSPGMISSVVSVMIADREEAVVWSWLQMVYERRIAAFHTPTSVADPSWLQVEDDLVSALMLASIQRKDLNDAAQQFSEACSYRFNSGRAAVKASDVSDHLVYGPMVKSWKRLAAAIIFYRKQHAIPDKLYDKILSFALSWSRAPFFNEAFLIIYHPSTPSAQLLCLQLRNSESASQFLQAVKSSGQATSKATLISLLDAAQLSLDQNLQYDASFLLNFASSHYPDLLPKTTESEKINLNARLEHIWSALRSRQPQSNALEPA